VPPDVQEAIISIVKPLISEENQKREKETAQQEKDKAFESEMNSLEKELDGKDGMPKFDKKKVIAEMMKSGNRIYDPRVIHNQINEKAITDGLIKQALKQQRGGRKSESTGKGDSKKPTGNTPSSFKEASQAMLSRISADKE